MASKVAEQVTSNEEIDVLEDDEFEEFEQDSKWWPKWW